MKGPIGWKTGQEMCKISSSLSANKEGSGRLYHGLWLDSAPLLHAVRAPVVLQQEVHCGILQLGGCSLFCFSAIISGPLLSGS